MTIKTLCAIALLTVTLLLPETFFARSAHAGCSDYAGPSVDWSGCRKRNLILSGNDFTAAKFNGADFAGSDLRESKYNGADFSKARITRFNISNSDLTDADFNKAEGSRPKFNDVKLVNANLEKAAMFRASFANSDLSNANINKAELGRANFENANLSGAQITLTNLARANFVGTNVNEANFERSWTYLTKLEGVDLSAVKNLTQEQLNLACGDENTKLPAGLTTPTSWPCTEGD